MNDIRKIVNLFADNFKLIVSDVEILDVTDDICDALFDKDYDKIIEMIEESSYLQHVLDDNICEDIGELKSDIESFKKDLAEYEEFISLPDLKICNIIILKKDKYVAQFHHPALLNQTERQMIYVLEILNDGKMYLCQDLKKKLFVVSEKYFKEHYSTNLA